MLTGAVRGPRKLLLALSLSLVGVPPPALAAAADPLAAEVYGVAPSLRLDPALSLLASEHARDIAALPSNAQLRRVKAGLRRSGLSDPLILPFSAVGPGPAVETEALRFVREEVRGKGYTHFGVGRVRWRRGVALSMIFVRRLIALSPLPHHVRTDRLEVRGVALPKMPLTALLLGPCAPDCPAEARELLIHRRGVQLRLNLPLPAEGRYTLEVMAKTRRGPEVAAVWELTRGPRRRGPRPPRWRSSVGLAGRLRQVRRARGLPPLRPDPRLRRAALAHAKAVCAADLAAHVLPGGPDPVARARAAGYMGPIAENIAIAPSEQAAHHNLMDSPSHRDNRLSPQAHRIGLGVVHRAASPTQTRAVCVVELFGL